MAGPNAQLRFLPACDLRRAVSAAATWMGGRLWRPPGTSRGSPSSRHSRLDHIQRTNGAMPAKDDYISTLKDIVTSFQAAYVKTPLKLKILDAFSVCALATALLQVSAVAITPFRGACCALAAPFDWCSNRMLSPRASVDPCTIPGAVTAGAAPSHRAPLRFRPLQFVYAKLVGTFPFNAFLAGFFCCVGSFVLTLSLRMKVSDSGSSGAAEFGGYALAMCVLFLASVNYMG